MTHVALIYLSVLCFTSIKITSNRHHFFRFVVTHKVPHYDANIMHYATYINNNNNNNHKTQQRAE